MLTEVADGTRGGTSKPEIDIVAVHGLNPFGKPDHEHAVSTWQKPKGQNGKSWLSDALPAVLPTARVFIYEYEANPTFNLDKTRFISRANELLERLRIVRRECPPTHPLIFLGHSLGGIMVKQALVNAHNNSRYSAIKESTYGLVFFGTPHRGGNAGLVGLGDLSIRIAQGLFRNPPNDMMDALRGGSMFEDVLQENWRHQLTHYKIVSFYEKYKQGSFGIIVNQKSATFGLGGEVENQQGLRANHSNLCCFDENDPVDKDNLFIVMGNLEEVARAAIQDHRESSVLEDRLSFQDLGVPTSLGGS